MDEKKFNKIFSAAVLIGMVVTITIITIFKLGSPGARVGMLIVAAMASLMGVLSTVLSANGIIWTFIFGILDVVFCSIVAYDSGATGNLALHVLYFLPMQFVGLWMWRKRGATGTSKVKARRMLPRQRIILAAAVTAGIAVAYLVLLKVDLMKAEAGKIEIVDRWKVFFDAAVLVLNIAGQILMSMAFFEQWIVWNLVNIFSILLWGSIMLSSEASGYTVVMMAKYCFYLLNSLNGLRIWHGLSIEGAEVEESAGDCC